MSEIKHFSSKSDRTAAQNLAAFIRMCREDLAVFGADLDWDATHWAEAATFTKLGTSSRGWVESDRLDDPFRLFAKAYFRYQQGHKPTRAKIELRALRVIEAALLQVKGQANIERLDRTVLDESAVNARGHYSPGAAYHCGRELQRLAVFVAKKHLIPSDVGTWKNPIRKPKDVSIQTGSKAKARREKKLPSEAAVNAMAEIFACNPSDPKNTFTASTFALTMCAPTRISEVLELPVDCEVEVPDAQGVVRYGWRFFSAKGFEGDIKWIPEVMVPVAKEGMRRIREMTAEARRLAAWIEKNPDKFYRHANCPDVADDQPLTPEQAAQALGRTWLSNTGLSEANGAHTLNSLWARVIERQPEGFPWLSREKRIRYSNALFCMTRNMLHAQRGTSPVLLWAPDVNVFNNDLGPRESLGREHESIFDRFGYFADDGSRIKVTSHQARHLISTLANRGGLTDEQLAKWAGRADPKHNRVYNHMSEWEMVAAAEALDTNLTLFGPDGEVSQHVPVTTQEINLLERGAIHTSEFGACVHDFIMSPCDKCRDCINCEEHVCVKGLPGRLERIKANLEEVERDCAAAEAAIAAGFAGADRWYEYHQRSRTRLRQLVEILESPDVSDGAQIKLRDGSEFSHLIRALREKGEGAIAHSSPDAGPRAIPFQLLLDSDG